MTPLIFISHSSQDRRVAARICDALERLGLGCWLASRDIDPGENFQEAIVRAIRSVRVMVLVFTGNANNSNEIKKEIALASQNGLPVIPLRVEDVVPSDAFLYELSTRQWVDAFDDWDRAMTRLAGQISEIAGQERPILPAPATGPRFSRTVIGLAVAAAVVLIVVGVVAYRRANAPPPAAPAPTAATSPAVPPATQTGPAPATAAPGTASPAAPPAAAANISGKWVTGELTNPYDQNQKSVLDFDFEQTGDTLFGSVHERTQFGGSIKGIAGGQIKGDGVTFYTQGMTTTGSGDQPYKENYHGTLKDDEIEFVRQNDLPTGGLPEKFTAKRE
jgi:hypothetical protein